MNGCPKAPFVNGFFNMKKLYFFALAASLTLSSSSFAFENMRLQVQSSVRDQTHMIDFATEQLESKLQEVQKPKGWSATGSFTLSHKGRTLDETPSFAWVESVYRNGLLSYKENQAFYFYTQLKTPQGDQPHISIFQADEEKTLQPVPTLTWPKEPYPPLDYLTYWLKGLPHPDHASQVHISTDGTVLSLTQNDWQVYYLNWYNSKIQLPKTLIIEAPRGRWEWKWAFDDWAWGDPSESPKPSINTL